MSEIPAEADVVIVGAGSTGCVLARRLSALDPDLQVVLVEAGPDYTPDELPPDLANGKRNAMIDHDWGYSHRVNSVGPRFPMPRGRVVGGSSAVNTCIALRGQPWDYEEWRELGLEEWGWDACLPAFNRLETDLDFADEAYHGSDGPLPIRRHTDDELEPWQAAFCEAAERLGFPEAPDSNAPDSFGWGPHAMNKIDGRRISIAECYLTAEVRARSNFHLVADALVHRVLLEGTRATGVVVEQRGRLHEIRAREVAICAGSINTPGVLLRSGIGPVAELARLGVERRVVNEAVGARILDHPGAAFFMRPRFGHAPRPGAPLIQTVLRVGSTRSPWPNDLILQPGSFVPVVNKTYPIVSIMISVGKVEAQGQIRFPTADPRARPTIESRLLDTESDRSKACEALMLGAQLVETPPMRRIARHLFPGKPVLHHRKRLDLLVRRLCDSGYHPCGTVPMGPESASWAACDGRGRVRGVDGLTIGDASLLPTVPSSNIHLPTLMVGERVAEWLGERLTA